MVGDSREKPGDMRHGKGYKRYRPAEGGDQGGEDARQQQKYVARLPYIHAHALGISWAKKQGVERLDKKKRRKRGYHRGGGEEPQVVYAHTREVAHAPRHETVNALVGGQGVEQGDGAGAKVAHHHANDDERHRAAHPAAQKPYHGRDSHCAKERRHHRRQEADDAGESQPRCKREQGHGKRGATGDAKDVGSRQRIAECRLKQQAARRERATRQERGDGLGQAGKHDDISCRVCTLATQGVYHIHGRNVHAAMKQRDKKQEQTNGDKQKAFRHS